MRNLLNPGVRRHGKQGSVKATSVKTPQSSEKRALQQAEKAGQKAAQGTSCWLGRRSSFIRRNVTRFGNWTSAVAAKRQGERQLGFGSTRACLPKSRPRFQGHVSANLHSKDERRRIGGGGKHDKV